MRRGKVYPNEKCFPREQIHHFSLPIFFEKDDSMLHLVYGRAGSGKNPLCPGTARFLSAKTAPETCSSLPRNRSHSRANAPCFAASAPVGPRGCRCSALPASPIPCSGSSAGLAGKRLDDGGRTILMSLALEEMSDTLQLFRPQAKSGEMNPSCCSNPLPN